MMLVPVCQMHQMANSDKNYLSFYDISKILRRCVHEIL
jgi:hypothetical protein